MLVLILIYIVEPYFYLYYSQKSMTFTPPYDYDFYTAFQWINLPFFMIPSNMQWNKC